MPHAHQPEARSRSSTTTTPTLARENRPGTHCLPGARKRAGAHERASARATRRATTTYQPSTPPAAVRVYLQRYHRPNNAPETTATGAGVAIGTARMLRLAPLHSTTPLPRPLCSREEKGKRKAKPKSRDTYRRRAAQSAAAFFFSFPFSSRRAPPTTAATTGASRARSTDPSTPARQATARGGGS
jgi:hypothetical protein